MASKIDLQHKIDLLENENRKLEDDLFLLTQKIAALDDGKIAPCKSDMCRFCTHSTRIRHKTHVLDGYLLCKKHDICKDFCATSEYIVLGED